ncbi:MAG: hypothetical protein U9N73_12550, partial [Candidatus Auribacterota bacterium]|nr:hypothetical protein [Candidatus Auribacterota bacterium]
NLQLFERVSPERLRRELELIFNEPDPPGAIDSMARYDELRFIHPRLLYSEDLKSQLVRLKRELSWFKNEFSGEDISPVRLYFGALIFFLSRSNLQKTGEKFNFSRKFLGQLIALKKREENLLQVLSSKSEVRPGRVYSLLRGLESEVILIIMARSGSEQAVSRIKKYFEEYRSVSTEVSGVDLKEMGIPPGPEYKIILDELLQARLNGRIQSKEEELRLAHQLVDKLKAR